MRLDLPPAYHKWCTKSNRDDNDKTPWLTWLSKSTKPHLVLMAEPSPQQDVSRTLPKSRQRENSWRNWLVTGCNMQHCSWFSLKRFSSCSEEFWWLCFWLGSWKHLELVVSHSDQKSEKKNQSRIQTRCLLHTWIVRPRNYATLEQLISHN